MYDAPKDIINRLYDHRNKVLANHPGMDWFVIAAQGFPGQK